MQSHITHARSRGLLLSNSGAVCVHGVLKTKCPDYGTVCRADVARPLQQIVDHPTMFRAGNDRVLIVEPYATLEAAEDSARTFASALGLRFAVGAPGSGPYAASLGESGASLALVPIAFARSQAVADLAVSGAAK